MHVCIHDTYIHTHTCAHKTQARHFSAKTDADAGPSHLCAIHTYVHMHTQNTGSPQFGQDRHRCRSITSPGHTYKQTNTCTHKTQARRNSGKTDTDAGRSHPRAGTAQHPHAKLAQPVHLITNKTPPYPPCMAPQKNLTTLPPLLPPKLPLIPTRERRHQARLRQL